LTPLSTTAALSWLSVMSSFIGFPLLVWVSPIP
jgi:hypothetical protein